MTAKPKSADSNAAIHSNPEARTSNTVALTKEVLVAAPPEKIFQALSTAEGLGKWWSYYTSGPDWENGEVLLKWPRAGH